MPDTVSFRRRRTWLSSIVTGALTGAAVFALASLSGVVALPAKAADSGTETSSAVEITTKDYDLDPATAPFPDLKVRVSQTRDLVSQGIQISWTGGKRSTQPQSDNGGTNFLQVAQCWGEDPDHPGHPDRRTCQYGGVTTPGSQRNGGRGWGEEISDPEDPDATPTYGAPEAVAPEDERYTAVDGSTGYVTAIPFVGVNPKGEVDDASAPPDRVVTVWTTDAAGNRVLKPDVDLSNNQFFTTYTTNEISWAPSAGDGSGSVPFEVQTAMQSSGLGCGTPITRSDGSTVGQSCWLVIIPRGVSDNGQALINKPGILWDSWQHHLAVKLDFKPLGVRCEIGAAERQLSGSELISVAISSWQPKLCLGENGSPFVLNESNEADALVEAAGKEPSALALASRPLDLDRVSVKSDPLAYAPIAIGGLAISFAIDRQPHPQLATADQELRRGLPLTDLKLTPRLVAKLLTASYARALPRGADKSHIGVVDDIGKNARTLTQDPDFLAINDPEWSAQLINGVGVSDALEPQGRSDLTQQLWQYVLADPEARAWLDGEPDPWGMIVNPWYSTNAAINPTKSGLSLPADSFPKADPIEKPDDTSGNGNGTGAVNLVTWRPYTTNFAEGAYRVLRGDDLELGAWDALARPPKFLRQARDLIGNRAVIALTTTPAANLFQTVTASLRNSAGQFVAPSRSSLEAAAAAMTPTAGHGSVFPVLGYDPASEAAKGAPTAYPLATPVYAALNPKQTDADLRAVYADLIRYAIGDGQKPGTDLGQLPPGYAPLPKGWVDQARAAADAIERGSLPTEAAGGSMGPAAANNSAGQRSSTARTTVVDTSAQNSPTATGSPAAALSGGTTPDDPEIGSVGATVPLSVLGGIAGAGAVPLVARIRRRSP